MITLLERQFALVRTDVQVLPPHLSPVRRNVAGSGYPRLWQQVLQLAEGDLRGLRQGLRPLALRFSSDRAAIAAATMSRRSPHGTNDLWRHVARTDCFVPSSGVSATMRRGHIEFVLQCGVADLDAARRRGADAAMIRGDGFGPRGSTSTPCC